MPTYRIVTLGCKLNQADSAALETQLRRVGFERAPIDHEGGPASGADVVILNTCTVTANADREARQIARRLRGANPNALLIATGCYAERDPAGLLALPEVDRVVSLSAQLETVPALAAEAFALDPDAGRSLGPLGATGGCDAGFDPGERTRALLKVQDGCDLRCSYCVIPSVRGASRSVRPEQVLAEIGRLIEADFREIVFTGVNTGDYGKDLDPPLSLHHLLTRAIEVEGLGRLRLNSLEPRTVTPDLIALLAGAGERIAPHLQIPLQSGCDTVLARMRRPYRTADYARLVERLHRDVRGIALGADVIAGFPGETGDELEATCRFIESSPLNYLHVFPYSPRPGTAAESLPGRVPPTVIKARAGRLRRIGDALSLRFRRSFVGSVRTALVLREIHPDGRLRALTDNFINLGCDPGGRDPSGLMNRLLDVGITEATERSTRGVFVGEA